MFNNTCCVGYNTRLVLNSSDVNLVVVSLAILYCLVSVAVSTVKSTPAHTDGQLTACAGDQISLTCTRDSDLSSGSSQWIASVPINCSAVIFHLSPITVEDCAPFIFQDISEVVSPPITNLSSTAVAIASTSMSGAVVSCFAGRDLRLARQVGSDITLCIPGELHQYKFIIHLMISVMCSSSLVINVSMSTCIDWCRNISMT